MDQEKKWVATSLTMWGAVVAFLTAGIPAWNALAAPLGHPEWVIDPTFVQSLNQTVVHLIADFGTLFGLALVVVGRFKATKKVTVLPPAKKAA